MRYRWKVEGAFSKLRESIRSAAPNNPAAAAGRDNNSGRATSGQGGEAYAGTMKAILNESLVQNLAHVMIELEMKVKSR